MKRNVLSFTLVAALAAVSVYAPAEASAAQKGESIYGYNMMTDQERNEYRQKMRDAKTADERQTLRDEHHKTMEARMRERGIDPSQMRGRGNGPYGPGPGAGGALKGKGPGMGPGPGSGSKGNGPGPRSGPPQG